MNVSVVMATYNGDEFLEEQLDSIRVQLDAGDELIICDDGSKDRTLELVTDYIDRYSLSGNVQLVRNGKNLGFSGNFHKALGLATRDYIFFSDQDDIWLPNKIAAMKKIMEETPDCQLLCCDYEPFASSSDAPHPPSEILKKMPNNGVLEKKSVSDKSIYIGALGCCMCMRKSFRDEIAPYWFEDWAHDDRCWRLAQCVDGLYVLHSNLVRHRLHGHNTATYGKYHDLKKRIAHFETMIKADEVMLQCMQDTKADKGKQEIVQNNKVCLCLRIQWMQKRNPIMLLQLMKYLGSYQTPKSYLVEIALVVKSSAKSS